MATYAQEQQRANSRSAGGSQPFTAQAPSTGDLVAPSQNQSLSRPGTYRPRNLLPGENPNTPSSYQAPAPGTKSVPYNTVDVPATRVDTPNNQLSGTPTPGTLTPSPNAGSLPGSQRSTGSPSDAYLPGVNGGNASPSQKNGANPNYQPSGISGGGGNNILRGAAGLASKFAKLPSILQVPLELLAPDSANESEGEYLKRNAGKLKPDPYLNGEKPSPKLKGNKFPKLPQPKEQESFKGGQDYGTWEISGNYTYKFQGEDRPLPLDGLRVDGKILSIFVNQEGFYKVVYAVVRPSPESFATETYRVGAAGFSNAPAENLKYQATRVGGATQPEDTQPREFPSPQPNPDFAPNYNSDPTLQPANNPQEQGMPTGQKSPDNAPGIKPGQPVKPEGKDAPSIPGLPLLPLLPLLPTLPNAQPPSSPSPAPNNSPSPSPLPAPNFTPGQTAPAGGAVKAPQFSDKPGEFPQPNPQPKPQTFTPNKQPGEAEKCCPSQGEDLAEIKRVLGVGEFPATLPLLSGGQTRVIGNIPDLLLWNSSNVDSVAGYFPAKVTVVQGDSSEKSFELKNIGHAFEELFGALLLVAQDADAGVNISARTATEVIQTKIAVQQGNQLLTAIQKFLGFTVKPVAKILKLNFSPNADGIDNKLANAEMVNFLKPSTTTYVGSEIAEKKEALPLLERILQNTEIVRMAHWHPLKPDKAGKDNITGSRIAEKKGKPSAAEVKQWDAYLKILKDAGYIVDDNSPKKDSK